MNAERIKTHRIRRAALASKMVDGTAFIGAAPTSSNETSIQQPDKSLFYLTGMHETDSALVLVARNGKVAEEILYCRARELALERWVGTLLGPVRAKNQLGIATTKKWSGPESIVTEHLERRGKVFLRLEPNATFMSCCLRHLANVPGIHQVSMHDLGQPLAELRMVKENMEIDLISRACQVTTAAVNKAFHALPQSRTEAEIAAQLSCAYVAAGGRHAFPAIVACGRNALTAHYISNSGKLTNGKLLLVDTGCELENYTADITRIYPVNGKFSVAQLDMYQMVKEVQRTALAFVKPQSNMAKITLEANKVMAQGLKDLGIMKGSTSKIMNSMRFAHYCYHSIGHMLGLNVHDLFITYTARGQPRPLVKNMVLTIEPGLYLDNGKDIPKELRNTGMRIEDTVKVSATGNQVLTAAASKDGVDIQFA